MSRPEQPFISLRNVRKAYGSVEVLKGVDLDVYKGQTVCIIGPSGSGKSTLIRTINALAEVQSGSIIVGETEINSPKLDRLALRKRVGMVFQQYNLFPHKTVLQNVMMAPIHVLRQKKDVVEQRARELLSTVRLAGLEDRYPGELSGGQQQRVAIARSLAMDPEVMLFDEVTAALDPETVREVLVTIRELAERGMTCVLVTHEMNFAREVADHVFMMDAGLIIEQGPPDEIFTNPTNPRARDFLTKVL